MKGEKEEDGSCLDASVLTVHARDCYPLVWLSAIQLAPTRSRAASVRRRADLFEEELRDCGFPPRPSVSGRTCAWPPQQCEFLCGRFFLQLLLPDNAAFRAGLTCVQKSIQRMDGTSSREILYRKDLCKRERIMCCGVVVPASSVQIRSAILPPLHVKKPNERVVSFIRPCSLPLFLPRTPDGRKLLKDLVRNAQDVRGVRHTNHARRVLDWSSGQELASRPSKLF